MPSRSDDVLADLEARGLLLDLAYRGVEVTVRAGHLDVRPASRVHPDEVAVLRQHKAALLVLALINDERCLDRLLALRRGGLDGRTTAGACDVCGDPLPGHRPLGRCGWCALAGRLFAGAPIPASIFDLFPEDITGLSPAVPGDRGQRRFDLAASA